MPSDLRALVVFADSSLHRSRISRRVLDAVATLPGVQVQDLYQLYPDLYIDVRQERELLEAAPLVVFIFQLGWYAMPALLKEWFDTVFKPEWARRQPGGLHGKHALAAVACADLPDDYREGGKHGRPFAAYLAPLEQTVDACGMHWLTPHVFYGAGTASAEATDAHAADLRALLSRYMDNAEAGAQAEAGAHRGT
jgi:glutathione-regulated potassium-efflux system ancillary protein KefF